MAWTAKEPVTQLDPLPREGFWHLCPDFVIGLLRSASGRLLNAREKNSFRLKELPPIFAASSMRCGNGLQMARPWLGA